MKDAQAGVLSNTIKTQLYKECERANGMTGSSKFKEAMKYINELMDRGFLVAGSYKIFSSVNDQFEEVYQPHFTIKVPCNYAR